MEINRSVKFANSWNDKTSLALALSGIVYLGFYSGQVLAETGSAIRVISEIGAAVIWALFLLDVLINFVGRSSLKTFLTEKVFDLICLAVPFFRFLRVFRVLFTIRGLGNFFKSRMHRAGLYLATLVPVIWYGSAIAVLDAEKGQANTPIKDLPEALWWAISTMSTLGFGEFPVSLEGRFITVLLMLTGIGMFSTAAGMFANWLISDPSIAKSSQKAQAE